MISLNRGSSSNTWSQYGIRLGYLVSQSPLVWYITKAESPYTLRILILKSMVASIPIMHASYSAILLVQSKHSFVVIVLWRHQHCLDTMAHCIRGIIEYKSPSLPYFGSFIIAYQLFIIHGHNIFIGEIKSQRLVVFHWLVGNMIRQHTALDGFLGNILDIVF